MNNLQTLQTSRQRVIFNLNCFWSCRNSLKCSLWDARSALAVPEEKLGSFPSREAITPPPGLHHRDEFWARHSIPHLEWEPESSNSAAEEGSPEEGKAPLPNDVREWSQEPELGFAALLWLEESTAAACLCQDAARPLPTGFCNHWAQCMGNRLGRGWAVTPKPWKQLCWGSCYELCGVTHLCAGSKHGGVNNP